MPFANSRNAYGFDPEDYDYQNAGGLLKLLREAMLKQAAEQGTDPGALSNSTSNGYAENYGNPQGLFGRILALQAQQGLLPDGNSGPASISSPDSSFSNLSRLASFQPARGAGSAQQQSLAPTATTAPNPAPGSGGQPGYSPQLGQSAFGEPSRAEAQNVGDAQAGSFQEAQALLPPVFLETPFTAFARPPFNFPRPLPPLDEWPTGSSKGPGAGKDFTRFPKEGETPPCNYCLRPTTREPGPLRYNQDHGIPKSRGGDNSDENKIPSCQECNLEKGPKTPQEYHEYLKRNGAPLREDHA